MKNPVPFSSSPSADYSIDWIRNGKLNVQKAEEGMERDEERTTLVLMLIFSFGLAIHV